MREAASRRCVRRAREGRRRRLGQRRGPAPLTLEADLAGSDRPHRTYAQRRWVRGSATGLRRPRRSPRRRGTWRRDRHRSRRPPRSRQTRRARPEQPASSAWRRSRSVAGPPYFNCLATFVCLALARPRPMARPLLRRFPGDPGAPAWTRVTPARGAIDSSYPRPPTRAHRRCALRIGRPRSGLPPSAPRLGCHFTPDVRAACRR